MRENLMCPAHKASIGSSRANWDVIFGGESGCAVLRRCERCDRFFSTELDDNICQSCRHVELVSSGKRAHGDFNGCRCEI